MRIRKTGLPKWPKTLPQAPEWMIEETAILPNETRHSEQHFLDALKRLCTNPVFRKDIIDLRQRYPLRYWNQVQQLRQLSFELQKELRKTVFKLIDRFYEKHGDVPVSPSFSFSGGGVLKFEEEAMSLCNKCGLEKENWRWVEWLVRNWDPTKNEIPPASPQEITPNFYPWRITVVDFLPLQHRRVRLELEQGASPKAARQAADEAVRHLPATYLSHASSITDTERQQLHKLFMREVRSGKRLTAADFKQLAQRMSKEYRPISKGTIRKEYYRFAGIQPRRYAGAASRDRRT